MLNWLKKKLKIKTNKDRIEELNSKVAHLTGIIESNELNRLRQVELSHQHNVDLLNSLQNFIKVNKATYYVDQDSGAERVMILYSIPSITLDFDPNGNIIKNDKFFAINALNLISFEDMKKIQKQIDKAPKWNGENR